MLSMRSGVHRLAKLVVEASPNPNCMVFFVGAGDSLLPKGSQSIEFTATSSAGNSPLASKLLKIQGVSGVLIAEGHVSVTKQQALDWAFIRPHVEFTISSLLDAKIPIVNPSVVSQRSTADQANIESKNTEVLSKVVELIDSRIRPAVAADGGDITVESFDAETGTLFIRLQGSCAGCPKSKVTLKFGIERTLSHYVPEVKRVVDLTNSE